MAEPTPTHLNYAAPRPGPVPDGGRAATGWMFVILILAGLACLFAADRYHQLDTEIRPRRAAGRIVLCDRYLASGLVVQRADGLDLAFLAGVNQLADPPDLAVILVADPGTIAGNGHACLNELLGWPGQNEVDRAAAVQHRLKEQDIGTGSGAGETDPSVHGRQLFF